MNEATITINGVELSVGQVMTLRVAATAYWNELQDNDFLGTDEHGRRMVVAYRDRLAEILAMMVRT